MEYKLAQSPTQTPLSPPDGAQAEAGADAGGDGSVVCRFARVGVPDLEGDVVAAGALTEGKEVFLSDFNHASWYEGHWPIGRGVVRLVGDEYRLDGKLYLDTEHGARAHRMLKAMGADCEWSWGFVVNADSVDQAGNRVIEQADIYEVSPVLKGAGVGTGTVAVKAAQRDTEKDNKDKERQQQSGQPTSSSGQREVGNDKFSGSGSDSKPETTDDGVDPTNHAEVLAKVIQELERLSRILDKADEQNPDEKVYADRDDYNDYMAEYMQDYDNSEAQEEYREDHPD